MSQAGFTLVELLVVMLVLGILAAISIPTFLNQKDKALDSDAKATARTAQTAIEVFAVQHDGRFTGASVTALNEIEATIPSGSPVSLSNITDDTYTVTVTSQTDNAFSITREASGILSYECTVEATGGCPEDRDWG